MNDKKYIFVHARLKEVRSELGKSQQEWADAVGVHVKTYRRWENEISIPADKLALLAGCGADVQYILTGIRSQNLEQVVAPSKEAYKNENSKDAGALNPRDAAWLELARQLPDDQRTRLQEIGDALVSAGHCNKKMRLDK